MNRYLALQKIIETGSFTKAAEVLGYTQSGISLPDVPVHRTGFPYHQNSHKGSYTP